MSWLIRNQADDFFNAYKVLKQNNEPIVSPRVVCLAFSLELYFKVLYYTHNLIPPRSHSILKLFMSLPRQIRRGIFFHETISGNPFVTRGPILYRKRFSGVASDYFGFIKHLEAISNGFAKWRYAHESQSLKYEEWFALALIESVKSASDATGARSIGQQQD